MKPEELAMLQFMMGINRKEKKIRDEFLKQKDPKLEDLLNIARNWQRSVELSRDLDNVEVENDAIGSQQCCGQEDTDSDDESVVNVKKNVSNYRRGKDDSWKEKHNRESGMSTNPNDNWSKQREIKLTCYRCSKNPTPGGHGEDKCPALEKTCY